MLAFFRRAAALLLDILFPSYCLSCRKDASKTGEILCLACLDRVPLHSAFFCAICSGRIPNYRKPCHRDIFLATAATSYDEKVVSELVQLLKYKSVLRAAVPLGTLAARHLELLGIPEILESSVLMPIPLSPERLRMRGYNQSEEIAKVIAEILKIPLDSETLKRVRNTTPQTELKSKEERAKNVYGCFAAKNISSKTVIIIDDVYTTGATMREAARALKAAGVRQVIGVAVARA